MIAYLLKSAICLLILLLVHRLLLQREAIYQFNRFFLLAAVMGSFLIPLIELEVAAEVPIVFSEDALQEVEFSSDFKLHTDLALASDFVPEPELAAKSFDWNLLFWSLYGLITLVFMIRFIRNIKLLLDKINQNIHVQFRGETLVLLSEKSLPFSFLSYIFVSRDYFESDQLSDAIFAHEQAHVRGRHTWDNLLIEALLVPLWFHPGLYLARQAIKLNHEFIADEAGLQVTPLDQYKTFLLAMMSPRQSTGLASSLNFSLTKKRFEMMKRSTANSTKWVKILFILPVFAVLVYFLSEKVTAQAEEGGNSESGEVQANQKDIEIGILLRADNKIEVDGQIIVIQELAELVKSKNPENTLVRFSAAPDVDMGFLSDVQKVLRKNDLRRVIYEDVKVQKVNQVDTVYTIVYGRPPFQMLTKAEYYSQTKFQIKYSDGEIKEFSYENLPNEYKKELPNPPGTIKKNVPSQGLFESWKSEKEFAIWIDGKVAPNSKLEEMKVTDIAHHSSSYVHSNARSERFPQKNQVNIYTFSGFENAYGSNSSFGKIPIGGTITFNSENPQNQRHTLNGYPVSLFQGEYIQYLEKLNSGASFMEKSKNEREELVKLFNDLHSKYLSLRSVDKRKVQAPVNPHLQHDRIEKDGGISKKVQSPFSKVPQISSVNNNIETVSSYQKQVLEFEFRINKPRLFEQPSNQEFEELQEQYRALDASYVKLPMEERRKVQRASFPYAKIEKDGRITYKKFELLTPEERNALGC